MFLARPLRSVSYEIRQLYDMSNRNDDYNLENILSTLFRDPNLKLDPQCFGYKPFKTIHGEMLLHKTELKSDNYFLKLIPNKYFVFIHENQRRVIPICSHLQ